jgi:histone-lysine N-methyltransferase ASH1L
MDIFRVERLWVNEAGKKFAFGFHYLRPHETFHEPSRRFFDNEVFRVPLYEVLPLDTIWAECWVTDPVTFCRGRPLRAREGDLYICEYRVDKTARLFNKISKPKYPTCTKSYAFTNFDLRLKVTRAYTVSQSPPTRPYIPYTLIPAARGAGQVQAVAGPGVWEGLAAGEPGPDAGGAGGREG